MSTRRFTRALRPRQPRRALLAVALLVVLAGGAAGGYAATRGGPGPIVVTDTTCAPGWVAPRSGLTVFTVENRSADSVYGIDIVGANQVSVYGEIDMLAPHTEDTLEAILPPGRYSFECESFAGDTLFSKVEAVHGPAVTGARPYAPVDALQIQLATLSYRSSLMTVMRRLARQTDALERAVERGDLAAARTLWLPAHLDYERLGAAYDTFGSFNAEINGRPLGLVGGVDSAHFHGFLRLEYGLWHGQSAVALAPVARALDRAVHGLVRDFPQMLTPANDLALRTHEILENTLQFELTGKTDEGSNTNLATAWANVQGTRMALAALEPLLRRGNPALLAALGSGLVRLQAAFAAYRRPDGSWTPLQALSTSQREQLDGETSGLLERLSLIPDLLELPIRPASDDD